MIGDRIWNERKLYDLIDGHHYEDLGDGVLRSIESSQPTWYEQKTRAYDTGKPGGALDAFQLDAAVERMTDMSAKAAIQLRMMGWDYSNIGAVVRDRKRRTGAGMVESGIRAILRHEKRRAQK